jgi:hypothetical protein
MKSFVISCILNINYKLISIYALVNCRAIAIFFVYEYFVYRQSLFRSPLYEEQDLKVING